MNHRRGGIDIQDILIRCVYGPMFSEPNRSVNQKSYWFTVQWLDQWLNHD